MDQKPKNSTARIKANAKYDAKAYARFTLRVKREQEEAFRAAAEAAGESVNEYIWNAVKARMESEKGE